MSESLALDREVALPETHGLSQVERVIDTFVAPSKTFHDMLRNTSWWLPFLLMVLFSLATTVVVDRQVGFDQVARTQLHNSPKQEETINQLPPEQQARRMSTTVKMTKIISYAIPVFLLVGFAFYALFLWASFNFLLGASTTFPQVFATCFYASLPYLLLNVLTILTLYVGGNADGYDLKNPVGTNLGYYLTDAAPWVRALLGRFDLIQLWSVALVTYGMSIIAKKTIAQAAIVVLGFWLIVTLFTVGSAAAFN